ncbi:hypothetical protein D3C71_1388440 [compost metagenome]
MSETSRLYFIVCQKLILKPSIRAVRPRSICQYSGVAVVWRLAPVDQAVPVAFIVAALSIGLDSGYLLISLLAETLPPLST